MQGVQSVHGVQGGCVGVRDMPFRGRSKGKVAVTVPHVADDEKGDRGRGRGVAEERDGQRAAEGEEAAAAELPLLVLSKDAAERPVVTDEGDVDAGEVGDPATNGDAPAQRRTLHLGPADAQEQLVDERDEEAHHVERLALDLTDRAAQLLQGHAEHLAHGRRDALASCDLDLATERSEEAQPDGTSGAE